MNGVLWKWTNYYNGWQSRWFVLKDGILSYYGSEEEVHKGCKGSINLTVCDVNVSGYDNTRFEIVIPSGQKYHLKASNIQERQKWVVAIGSCKACHIEPDFEVASNSGFSVNLQINEINSKESEMRLYMELMNQQILLVKNQLSENKIPDINSINDLTSTLNAACDTFLASLRDLMSLIAFNSFVIVDSPPTHAGSPGFSSLNSNNEIDFKMRRNSSLLMGSRSSIENSLPRSRSHKSTSHDNNISVEPIIVENRRKTNFFFQMIHSFVDWTKEAESQKCISTENYINSFWCLLHFLDYFDKTPILTLKSDITTCLKRLSKKFEVNPEKFSSLENIIKSESNSHLPLLNVDSATYVIRSLTRCLLFTECLLQYLHNWISTDRFEHKDDGTTLEQLLTRAYDNTLRMKLNWLDQGLFTIILKSLPSLSEVICHLLCQYDTDNINKPVNVLIDSHKSDVDQLLVDMNSYRSSIVTINLILTQCFADNKIEL